MDNGTRKLQSSPLQNNLLSSEIMEIGSLCRAIPINERGTLLALYNLRLFFDIEESLTF